MAAEGADDNAQPQPADAVSATLGGLAGSNASDGSSGSSTNDAPGNSSGESARRGLGATVGAVTRTLPQTADRVARTATGTAAHATAGALPQTQSSSRVPQNPAQPAAGSTGPVGHAVTDTVDHTVAHLQASKKAVTDDAARTAAQVAHLATYAVQHPPLEQSEKGGHVKHPVSTDGAAIDQSAPQSEGTSSAPSDQRTPDTGGVATLSVPTLVSGVEDAANDLTGGVLQATHLDQTVQAPQVKVLSSALDDLGVSQMLPSIPVPEVSLPLPTAPLTSAPVVGAPVGDVIGSLPVRTGGSLQVPGTLPPGGGPVTADPTGPSGVTVPVPVDPAAPTTLGSGGPTTIGAIPALPVLLPFETFPEMGLQGAPTGLTSLTGGDAKDPSVYLSRALLNVEDGAADTGSIPVPTSPHAPAGHDAGPGAGQQDRAALTSLALPGGRLTSPVREYSWHVPAAPTSDPGFSPD